MADIREQILERLMVVAKVRGISGIYRNKLTFSDGDSLPAVVIFDGSEDATDANPANKGGVATRKIMMLPELRVVANTTSEDIGESINLLRLRIIAAVLNDTELRGLTSDNESVWYDGCAMTPSEARAGLGFLGLRFRFGYYLKLGDLT